MQPDDRTRVLHMIEAGDAASSFLTGRSRDSLDTEPMLLFAPVRAIEVFGEAAAKVSASTRASNPEVPWLQIVAMRNRLIHAYFDIDREILLKTATEEIPALLPQLRKLLSD
ncbi:MAG TPA: HepT-like ribonuclease domain-containing protein [Rhizomicrobium sp.]|jgi:uncharacterized protein with HEPN domain